MRAALQAAPLDGEPVAAEDVAAEVEGRHERGMTVEEFRDRDRLNALRVRAEASCGEVTPPSGLPTV
jgi:hypothetical protein